MGPSGVDKSTLFAALAGFVLVQSGTLSCQGIYITSLKQADRPMAMLFQDNNLFPQLTAERNIALAVTLYPESFLLEVTFKMISMNFIWFSFST